MEWRDTGFVIGVRKHGEASVILETMTEAHGRHLGLVRGGRSRTQQPVLQPGNIVDLTWRARLEDHLGQFTVEPVALNAARLMTTACGVNAVQVIAAHVRLLPERESDPALYRALADIAGHLADPETAALFLVRFELAMLERLGFGLDLERCALSGQAAGLAYVSPKTGRAVTADAGKSWADRLLPLPGFLAPGSNQIADAEAIRDAFALTGHFLVRNVYEPRGIVVPAARDSFISAVARALAA